MSCGICAGFQSSRGFACFVFHPRPRVNRRLRPGVRLRAPVKPNGLLSQSPGLQGTSYPGSPSRGIFNRNAVAAPGMIWRTKTNAPNRVAVGRSFPVNPRKALARQPWAVGRNPVRIVRPVVIVDLYSPSQGRHRRLGRRKGERGCPQPQRFRIRRDVGNSRSCRLAIGRAAAETAALHHCPKLERRRPRRLWGAEGRRG